MGKTGWGVLLLSLVLTAPCLAQGGPRCSAGTVGSKCVNPGVANQAAQQSRLRVFNASQTFFPLSPSQEAGIANPHLQSQKFQPRYGVNARGPHGLSGGGSPNFVYGSHK